VRVRVCHTVKPLPKLTTKPNPRSVRPAPDLGRTADQVISAAAGGSVTATGANGISYTLTVPPNALSQDTKISVTPVRAIGSLKMKGGLVGAALLQPAGLHFWAPVRLTIAPRAAPKTGKKYLLLGFASHDDGTQFHLTRHAGKTSISITLDHFTEAGAALGDVGDLLYTLLHAPFKTSDEYQQLQAAMQANADWVKAHPGQELTLQPLYTTEQILALLVPVLAKEFDNEVEPELELAIQDEFDPTQALQDALNWQRAVELQNLDEHFASRLNLLEQRIQQVVDQVLNKLAKPCSTATRTLTSYPALGLFIDQKDALNVYSQYRNFIRGHLVVPDDARLQKALLPCRPAGLKFSGLKWRTEVYDKIIGTSHSQHELVSAHVCGHDPDVIWQTQVSEDDNWPLYGHYTFGGIVAGQWMPGDGLPIKGDLAGTVNRVDLQLGTTVTAMLTLDAKSPPAGYEYQLIPQVTQVQVEEDLSCPRPAP
jgi:hypothetical protein